jgi:peptide/nickel transport system permease protein
MHPGLRRAAQRVRRFAFSLAGLVLVSFVMVHLVPGDPVRAALGTSAPESLVASVRHDLGLDRSLPVQLTHYVQGLLTGDLGTSISTGVPVGGLIASRAAATLALVVPALVLTFDVAVPTGLGGAVITKDGRRPGARTTFVAVAGLLSVVPEFLLAVGLVSIFAVTLQLLPVAGNEGAASHVLPVIALAAAPTAVVARLVQVEAARELAKPYVQTARAKRLSPTRIHLRHVLPNALSAALTVGGVLFAGLVAGTVLVENIFAWPGLGTTVISSIVNKDYPVVQAIVLVYGAAVLTVNLGIDLLLGWLDPRSTIMER